MYNAKYIIAGLIVFALLFTAPFWLASFSGSYKRPEVVPPKTEKECVEPVAFMRSEHMQLLNLWRDEALRNENRVYVAANGKQWEISLQNTCMKCHNNPADFCDKCHVSNSVYPYCWTCHVLPEGKK